MIIRKSTPDDLSAILRIYAEAREFMRGDGNPTQWKEDYPPRDMVERDVSPDGRGYVCEGGGEILGVFYFGVERDPTYEKIDGSWLNDEPCGVVHRLAARRGGGAGTFCLNWCFEQCGNLKIDTHEDNRPMRALLEKLGFRYCGVIWVLDGTEERIAFQKTRAEADKTAGKNAGKTAAITFEKATKADLPGILSLYKAWAEEEKEDFFPDIEPASAEAVWQDAANKGVTYFVAKDGDTVAASCYVCVIPNLTWGGRSIAFIENVITLKSYRRQGIGKAVMRAAVDFAISCGCCKATLQSNAKRREAHDFYRSIGFDGGSKLAFEMRFGDGGK